jgi:hypothetical protein
MGTVFNFKSGFLREVAGSAMQRWILALLSINVVGLPIVAILEERTSMFSGPLLEECMREQTSGFCVVINPKEDYSIRHYILCFLLLGSLLIVASSRLQAEQDSTSRRLGGLSIKRDSQPTKAMFEEIDLCRQRINSEVKTVNPDGNNSNCELQIP